MTPPVESRPPAGSGTVTAYAIAHLYEADPHPDIAQYMERITATFEPFGGRFVVHGSTPEVVEGSWPGHVVIIGFPSMSEARGWWQSTAYRAIAPLRSRHIEGNIVLVQAVSENYAPSATARLMRLRVRG